MPNYSPESKEKTARQLLPPHSRSVASVSRETGVSEPTLYAWKKQFQERAAAPSVSAAPACTYNAKARLGSVIATAAMNEAERSAWCREQGLYPEQLDAWRQAFESMDDEGKPSTRTSKAGQQTAVERKSVQRLQKELARKDKALAEAAALLVLSKKAQAIWGVDEAV